MRTLFSILLTSSLALLVGGVALAKSPEKFSGEVSHVDAKARTISVKNSDRTLDFKLAPEATVISGPRAEDISMLKPGEKVDVTYSDASSGPVASRVEVAWKSPSSRSAHPYGGTYTDDHSAK